jgi:peptidoglycan/xylan/chitin deacetylase (PgdA/CDA1 family)
MRLPRLALTFDDDPDQRLDAALLDVLEDAGANRTRR